jgi:hypothetical protein
MLERQPVPEAEAIAIIERAIREVGGRALTRETDLYLATVVTDCLWERLAVAGVVKIAATTEAGRGQTGPHSWPVPEPQPYADPVPATPIGFMGSSAPATANRRASRSSASIILTNG